MDVLVLLVGTNPLPAWVTFKALHDHAPDDLRPRKVLLVHSDGTAPQAQRLVDRIDSSSMDVLLCPIGSDAASSLGVRTAVKKGMAQFPGVRTVLLDYTGGTKQMVVQSFAACQELLASRAIFQLRCSYLDANRHQLRFDDDSVFPLSGDLRRLCVMSLRELLELHACKLRKDATSSQPLWPRTASAIWQAASATDGRAETYSSWKRQFRSMKEDTIESASADGPSGFVLPAEHLRPIAEAFVEECGARVGPDRIVGWEDLYRYFHASNTRHKKRAREDTAKFFDGSWLESLLASWIGDRVRAITGLDLQWGVYAEPSGSRSQAELDVVMVRGYQLFLFSCTTAKEPHLAKNKAFEAIHRARQFGGDEARSTLVTLFPDELPAGKQGTSVADLHDNITTDTGGHEQLRVWGIEALRNFDATWMDLLRREDLW